MISTYGPLAQRYALALGDIDAIVTEPEHLFNAYNEAVRRRHAGELFYGMFLLEENHDRVLTGFAPAVFAQTQDDDRRRWLLNNVNGRGVTINGRPAPEVLAEPNLTAQAVRAAIEFLNLCPALLVRSSLEYERISAALNRRRPFEVVVLEPLLPEVERRAPDRPAVVIWAPERDVAAAAFHAFALAEVRGDLTLVSADGLVPPGSRVSALRAGDPRVGDVLATASSIVLTNATDPGAAIAFARRGYGIVAPVSSGAQEFVRDAYLYDPAVQRQLHVATMKSLAESASLRALPAQPPRAPGRPALPRPPEEFPLVSVVTATYNRRDDLRRMLTCLRRQTYPRLEAIVVNDGGDDVDDIVAGFPFARGINLPHGGALIAAMTGVAAMRGEYVQFLADDDWLFPDHVERLATAMIGCGAKIAHSNTLIRYVTRLADGTLKTTGYNGGVFAETATPTEAMVFTPIAGNALMWHRSVFDEIGSWREDCDLADQEIQLRAGQRYAFVWVDQMTAEWRIHESNASKLVDSVGDQRRIYEEFHPASGRPILERMRAKMLDDIAARPPGFIFGPTFSLVEPAAL